VCPAFKWFGYHTVGTGIRSNPKAEPCPAFGCKLYMYEDKNFSCFLLKLYNLQKNENRKTLNYGLKVHSVYWPYIIFKYSIPPKSGRSGLNPTNKKIQKKILYSVKIFCFL
jgi:hypothetical protein